MANQNDKNEKKAQEGGGQSRPRQGRRGGARRTPQPAAESGERSAPNPQQPGQGQRTRSLLPKAPATGDAGQPAAQITAPGRQSRRGRKAKAQILADQPVNGRLTQKAEPPANYRPKGREKPKAEQPEDNQNRGKSRSGRQKAQSLLATQVAEALAEEAAAPRPRRERQPAGREKQAGAGRAERPAPVAVAGDPDARVRIIPLGGLGEVGKNITVFESAGESFIVDCGMTFPDESMPGVDLVLPDFTYVIENRERVKGIFITHGHEDHIGGLPFLLKQEKFPVYATMLTMGLIENKLREHNLLGRVQLHVVKPGDVIRLSKNAIEYINVNHSIPDACALAIHTPAGVIVHTGDFKVDFTPIRGDIIDLARFGELGRKGVLALLSDSTNAERPGSTMSERTVGESFDKLFASAAEKRILVATFSSNVHRVQQIVDAAVKYGRKVAVQGRSMENVINKALEIGYLDIPSGILINIDSAGKYQYGQIVIITTGSQGEPMSALTRMAMGDHRKVTVGPSDCIIISASPIPGNEKLVTRVINELLKLGAEVVYEKMYDIHVSGHACQDEQKMMLALTRPRFFMPMHGEFKHLKKHAETAYSMGLSPKNVVIGDVGRVVELTAGGMKPGENVPAGKVLVDGLGVGDVGSVVLRDRKHLAQDGLIVVVTTVEGETGRILSGPDIVSRGFVYVRESEEMIARAKAIAKDIIEKNAQYGAREYGALRQRVRDELSDYFWQVTKRSPMILPVVQEIRG